MLSNFLPYVNFKSVFSRVDFTAVDADVAVFRASQMADQTFNLGRCRLRLSFQFMQFSGKVSIFGFYFYFSKLTCSSLVY